MTKQTTEQARNPVVPFCAAAALLLTAAMAIWVGNLKEQIAELGRESVVAGFESRATEFQLVSALNMINEVLEDNPDVKCSEAKNILDALLSDVEMAINKDRPEGRHIKILWDDDFSENFSVIVEAKDTDIEKVLTLPDPSTELEDTEDTD